jgi:hypothetical protein
MKADSEKHEANGKLDEKHTPSPDRLTYNSKFGAPTTGISGTSITETGRPENKICCRDEQGSVDQSKNRSSSDEVVIPSNCNRSLKAAPYSDNDEKGSKDRQS